MGADYSFFMKSTVTFALTFFGYIISVLASVKGYYFMLWLSFGQSLTFYLNLSQHTVHEDFNHHILVLSVGVAINAFIIILLHIWGCSKYCGRNAFHNVATARTNSHTNLYPTTISRKIPYNCLYVYLVETIYLDFLHCLVELDSFSSLKCLKVSRSRNKIVLRSTDL